MNIKVLTGCALLLVLGVTWSAEARAQDDRAGTQAAEYLLIPLSARTASLGSAVTGGLADLSGIEALQTNPAALMANVGTSAQFSRMEYVADIGVNYFGVAQRFGNNNIGLSVAFWDIGDIPETTEALPESDLTYGASNVVVGLSLARQFTDRIAAGFTVKGLSETIADMSATGLAFDAGMTYVVGESGLRFGVAMRNFGASMAFGGSGLSTDAPTGAGPDVNVPSEVSALSAELPSVLSFGASYTRQVAEDITITGLADFRSLAYDQDLYSAGLEAGYSDLFFVRGGFQLAADMDASFWQGWNAGAGLNLTLPGVNLKLDYAYRGTQYFSGVNLFTVGLTL